MTDAFVIVKSGMVMSTFDAYMQPLDVAIIDLDGTDYVCPICNEYYEYEGRCKVCGFTTDMDHRHMALVWDCFWNT